MTNRVRARKPRKAPVVTMCRTAPAPGSNKRRTRYRATYANGRRVEFAAASDAAALKYAKGLGAHKARSRPKSVLRLDARRRNPSRREELERAARALEDFTGHAAKIRRAKAPKAPKAGWALGTVAEIGYIATRDGERALYVHKFKRRSRPQLVSSSDGSQLYLLGGAYSVTDRGIVDA